MKPLEVEVEDGNIEKALSKLKKKGIMEGIMREMKKRRFYEKPSAKKKRKREESERRLLKKKRRMQNKNRHHKFRQSNK